MPRNPKDLLTDTTRTMQMGLIFQRDERNEVITVDDGEGNMVPQIQGIGFHQHSTGISYDDNGIEKTEDCDYVVMDLHQIMQLKMMLAGIELRPLED